MRESAQVSITDQWVVIRRLDRKRRKNNGMVLHTKGSLASYARLLKVLKTGWRHTKIGTVHNNVYLDHYEYVPTDPTLGTVFVEVTEIEILKMLLSEFSDLVQQAQIQNKEIAQKLDDLIIAVKQEIL